MENVRACQRGEVFAGAAPPMTLEECVRGWLMAAVGYRAAYLAPGKVHVMGRRIKRGPRRLRRCFGRARRGLRAVVEGRRRCRG